jgi:NADH dehydrogenase
MKRKRPRIVIVGGGFGGLTAAVQLGRRLGPSIDILLIDKNESMVYTPWLYRVPAESFEDLPKSRGCHLSYDHLFHRFKHIEFRQGEVTQVQLEEQYVVVDTDQTVKYDYLVFAPGSEIHTFGTPGALEYGIALKRQEDICRVRDTCLEHIRSRETSRIVIIGAGATGTEIACDLADSQSVRENRVDITVVDGNPKPLYRFGRKLAQTAERRFEKLGIHFQKNSLVKRVDGSYVLFQEKDSEKEQSLQHDLVLWCAGVKPSRLTQTLSVEKTERGRIAMQPTLQSASHANVFVLGDAAGVYDARKEMEVPPTAWAASDQAMVVAKNIIHHLKGRKLIQYHPPKYYPGIVALGHHYAAGGGGGVFLKGRLALFVKELIALKYFISIMSFFEAWSAYHNKEHSCSVCK